MACSRIKPAWPATPIRPANSAMNRKRTVKALAAISWCAFFLNYETPAGGEADKAKSSAFSVPSTLVTVTTLPASRSSHPGFTSQLGLEYSDKQADPNHCATKHENDVEPSHYRSGQGLKPISRSTLNPTICSMGAGSPANASLYILRKYRS